MQGPFEPANRFLEILLRRHRGFHASEVICEPLDLIAGSLVQDHSMAFCILNLGNQLAVRREIRQKLLNPIELSLEVSDRFFHLGRSHRRIP